MKRFLSAAVLGGVLAAPGAAAETATGEYPACGKPTWLEAMLVFRNEGREADYERWLNQGRCFELTKGTELDVVRVYGDAKRRRAEVEVNGVRLFTVRRAIAQEL